MQLIKNNAYSSLAGALTNIATSLTVSTGTGDRFPIVTGSDYCMLTLQDASNNIEIIKVTARASASDSMTIQRGQEGTTARAWNIGDVVELRITAGTLNPLQVMAGAATAGAIRTALGSTGTGDALFTAVDAAAARTAIGASTTGSALLAAADAASARSVIGALGAADTIANATNAGNSAQLGGVAAASYAQLAQAQSFTKAQRGAYVVLTDGATITPDFSLANHFRVQLGGNRTLDIPTNLVEGQSGVIDIYQDATGGRTLAYAWCWDFTAATAPTLTTSARAKDKLGYMVDVYKQSTVTISIASPGAITYNNHGLLAGQKVRLTTTGALPTGLAANTTYYVNPIDANTFSLAATQSGAPINTSGTQSGVHTLTAASISANLMKALA